MSARRTLPTLALGLTLIACDEDPPSPGGGDGGGVDLGAAPDLGTLDLGAPDLGPTLCAELGTPLGMGVAPPRRDDAAATFDPECGRLFVFFGDQGVPQNCGFSSAAFSNEGFVFDVRRGTWSTLGPQAGPNPVDRGGVIWDATRKRVVLFGGRWRAGTSGPYDYPTKVWAFDPEANLWTELADDASGPRGRMDFVIAADGAQDRLLVSHGGRFTPDFSGFEVFADTWSFDLAQNTWARVGENGPTPEALVYPAGALDAARGQLWVFSGSGADAFTAPARQEMWALDLATNTWTEIPFGAGFPGARFNSGMVWDAAGDRLVLFGGHDNTELGNNNDLWSFNLSDRTWREVKRGDTFNKPALAFCDFPGDFTNADLDSPERRAAHIFVAGDPGAALTYGGNTDCGLANDTWSLDLATDTWSQVTVSPSGMTCPRTGNPDCAAPTARMCD